MPNAGYEPLRVIWYSGSKNGNFSEDKEPYITLISMRHGAGWVDPRGSQSPHGENLNWMQGRIIYTFISARHEFIPRREQDTCNSRRGSRPIFNPDTIGLYRDCSLVWEYVPHNRSRDTIGRFYPMKIDGFGRSCRYRPIKCKTYKSDLGSNENYAKHKGLPINYVALSSL